MNITSERLTKIMLS